MPASNSPAHDMEHNRSTSQISFTASKSRRSTSARLQVFGKILIIGEKLRLSFHMCHPVMVKDRRYHLRMYAKCFVGNEAVDWLMAQASVKDRPTAVLMLKILQQHNVIHHVCDDHIFKDTYLFYRFRVDDNTLPLSRDTDLYIKGHQLYHEITELGSSSIMKLHNEFGTMYDKSCYGTQLVNWLVKNGHCTTRQDAIGLGKDLLEIDLIRHGEFPSRHLRCVVVKNIYSSNLTMDHHFKDERVLYIFHPNLSHLKIIDLLEMDERPRSISLDSTVQSQKQKLQSPIGPLRPKSLKVGDVPDFANNRPKFHIGTPDRDDNLNLLMSESDGEDVSSPGTLDAQASKLTRSPTAEDLENAEATYVRQSVKILGDSVGFGFVVRGDGPSYVQTVDPSGPAAKAGLKTGHILYFVNGEYVLNKSHTEVARIILKNTQQLAIDVMVPRNQAIGTDQHPGK